jgi:hypothetical protein
MGSFVHRGALVELIRQSSMLDKVESALQPLFEYAQIVAAFELKNEAARVKNAGSAADTQSALESIDRARTAKHNACIAALSKLNKLAELAGTPPVFVGCELNGDNRKEIAHAIFAFAAQELVAADIQNGQSGQLTK